MSTDMKMAVRNIGRNRVRTVLTMSAIGFAALILVFMLSFQLGSYEAMVNSSVKIHTGHFQIQAAEYNDNKNMRYVIEAPDVCLETIKTINAVAAYTVRSNGFSLISSDTRTRGGLVTGIDPAGEALVSNLETLVRKGSYLDSDDMNQALVGALLARHLKVDIGDELTLLGQGRDGSIAAGVVEIKGIFSSGLDEFDRQTIQIPIHYFNDIFFMQGAVHKIVCTAGSLYQVDRIKQQLLPVLNKNNKTCKVVVLDWKQLMPGLVQGIKLDMASAFIFYIILVLVVALSIMNTFMMAILERTKEFGIMLALGVQPKRLLKLVLLESGFLTLAGVVIGTAAGTAVTLWFQSHGIRLEGASEILKEYGMSGSVYPRLSWISAFAGPLAVCIITLTAAFFSALKIFKLKPAKAINGV